MTEYSARMAELARSLRSQRTAGLTLQHVVTVTSEMVKNCDDVSISVARADGRVEVRSTGAQGSHQLASSAAASGLAILPDGTDVEPGGDVEVELENVA